MKKNLLLLGAIVIPGLVLAGCGDGESTSTDTSWRFDYDNTSWTPTIGSKTNDESYDYDSLMVNPITNELREDFAYGVDASMVSQVEECGGVYYNENGQEQDVFQILADGGVNFFRVRLWNNPSGTRGRTYGGGNNDLTRDIEMMKRAQAVGMNICLDFHYSDFWADPDKQQLPEDWRNLGKDEIADAIKEFTVDSLNTCKEEGLDIDAVQIGNEINNGMAGDYGAIDWSDLDTSFEYIAELIQAGIDGAKSVYPNTKTIVHLANGTNTEEFKTYFGYLDQYGVNYDIVGASYYPRVSGNLEKLQENLDTISAETGRPVMVVETSWGFTNEWNEYTDNTHSASDEDKGGYLTSIQAQATSLRDIMDVISKVPSQMGIGCFWWEPGWLPVEGAGWATKYGQSYADHGTISYSTQYEDGLATWPNQAWFSYTGKALPTYNLYNIIKEGGANKTTEVSLEARATEYEATINLAASETLPETGSVVTNLDAIREAPVVWDEGEAAACATVGTHTVHGVLDGKYDVVLTAECIENFIVDPGFENQGDTDVLKDPWYIRSLNPEGEKIVKLDRKSDTRTGTTDLNWYYSASDYSFDFYQTIEAVEEGTYELSTWLLAPDQSEFSQTLVLYITVNGTTTEKDISSLCTGWSNWYQEAIIDGIEIPEGATVEVGIKGTCSARAWGHNDDWSLVRI